MSTSLYTQHDLDIALKDDFLDKALQRIESHQSAKFGWVMGSILGIYVLIIGTCLAKVSGLL